MGDSKFKVISSESNRFIYFDYTKNLGCYYYQPPTSTHSMSFSEFAKVAEEKDAINQQEGYPIDKLLHECIHKTDKDYLTEPSDHISSDRFFYLQETIPATVEEPIQEAIGKVDWFLLTKIKMQYGWSKLKSTVLWASQRGCITQCHYDECHNLMAQCSGEKRFILFPPSDFAHLYPYPLHHAADRQSQVNLYNPQLDRFPLADRATGLEAYLHPGDVLYIPPHWWHHVETLTASVGMNFWFELAPVDVKSIQYPLDEQQLMSVRRNTETFLSTVLPPREIGHFLRTLALHRWDSVEHETDVFEALHRDDVQSDVRLPGFDQVLPYLSHRTLDDNDINDDSATLLDDDDA